MGDRAYLAIDLKSFYASVECVDRGLDPMTTNLVVADKSRTDKTICLAVSPPLKAWGLPGRPRLFEVVQRIEAVNASRRRAAPGGALTGASFRDPELRANPSLAVDYLVAPPQMARYLAISAQIYDIYLRYVAPEDIHSYSIDEVFIDVTCYLKTYGLTPRELAMRMILDVLRVTGITATAGIGPNLYLCKVAMDIEAKYIPPDQNGVRIAELDELSYRRRLWGHRPLTDFWRVGRGYAKKLESVGLYTMGDVARCSLGGKEDLLNEELLYRMFGVNAELLIDHAWGWEPCTIADIKAYRPSSNSIGSGQVLHCPYEAEKARLVAHEMTDLLVLDLVDKGLVTDQLVLVIGFDRENLADPERRRRYRGPVTTDFYGRAVPKHVHGAVRFDPPTSSSRRIVQAVLELYDRIVDPALLVRRINVTAGNVVPEQSLRGRPRCLQMDLFTDYAAEEERERAEKAELEREKRVQEAVIGIKKKFGKNAILKAMNLEEGATARDRNSQIGGHRA